jgi:hypothetical protein
VASTSRTRPPTSGSRDGEGQGGQNVLEALAALDVLAPQQAVRRPAGVASAPLLQLVEEASRAPSEALKQELAGRINGELEALARGGGSREVADVLLGLLEGGKLRGLEDASGRSCQAVAVESLLSLGFPYALEVRPEDLASLRELEAEEAPGWRRALVPLAVLLAGIVGQLGLEAVTAPAERSLPVLLVLAVLAMVGGMLARPRSAPRRLGVVVLAVVSALGVWLALLPGYGGLVSGLAGLLAAFLLSQHES